MNKSSWLVGTLAAGLVGLWTAAASAQQLPKVTVAMSGWTGFAPVTLAKETGIFRKNGIEVEIKKMPTSNRHQAMAAGEVQAITTTVDTHILYASSGVDVTQVLVLDSSHGGDGIAVREGINGVADLKGKQVAVQFGGVPQFWLAYVMKKNGLSINDVQATNLQPSDAANAFVAGQFDAAVTYEPYLSKVREAKGKIIVTSDQTPGVIIDTLAFQPDYIKKNPKVVQAFVDSWFEALEMIKADQQKAFEIMGKDVNQTPEQFAASAKFVRWYDKDGNRDYFAKTLPGFMKEVQDVMLEAKLIRKAPPNLEAMMDPSFVK
ncbi:ABC transporter substrate-binding protein [Azospirillum soli]|uniref:ABC transporter substrate-binding protein n=1 Tax=Azospirillum soli TaxID=1304799 RepID=UPI001AE5434D|nr:ABC transporter substrate-binding protein [Azospirillum soli]MBP2313589.1 NitT/TauT family transport system substrate-binding protein [Azospirillum soli]